MQGNCKSTHKTDRATYIFSIPLQLTGHLKTIAVGLVAIVLVSFGTPCSAQTNWHLIWNDEFNGAVDAKPDAAKWTYDLGNNNGWGNQELQRYTAAVDNAHTDGRGNLVIRVQQTSEGYTSARIKTEGLFSVQYGRIEVRMKVPKGRGLWSACWLLGENFKSEGWPKSGEADIAEIGKEPSVNYATIHGPGYSGGNGITAKYALPDGQQFSDDFHIFALQWAPGTLTFFVDSAAYHMVSRTSLPPGAPWVFDKPFFLILNVAVGGNFPGNPDSTAQFPQDMLVDYIRVYQVSETNTLIAPPR